MLDRPFMRSSWPFMVQARKSGEAKGAGAQWSQRVTQSSNALDLEAGVFTWDDPRAIARSLKNSADLSLRRKATSFQSAMSMLTFYLNRAGDQLPPGQRSCLEAAKDELRELYGRARRGTAGADVAQQNKRGPPGAATPQRGS